MIWPMNPLPRRFSSGGIIILIGGRIQPKSNMTESEYKQLKDFEHLPLYDDDSPFCSSVDQPKKEERDGTLWIAVHEATELAAAQEHLKKPNLVPKGGIRFWDGEKKKSTIFAYFWEHR